MTFIFTQDYRLLSVRQKDCLDIMIFTFEKFCSHKYVDSKIDKALIVYSFIIM